MDMIKEFYIQQLKREMPQLERAFHWRPVGTRSWARSGRMPFVMSFSLSLSGSVALAVTVDLCLFVREELALPAGSFVPTTPTDYVLIVLSFLVGLVSFAVYYAVLVLRYSTEKTLRDEAHKLGLEASDATGRHE